MLPVCDEFVTKTSQWAFPVFHSFRCKVPGHLDCQTQQIKPPAQKSKSINSRYTPPVTHIQLRGAGFIGQITAHVELESKSDFVPFRLKWVDSFTPGRFALVLAIAIAGCFPNVVLGGSTFFFRDFGFFSYPLASYHRDCFWRGEIPLWNPYNNCGIPFLGQWNTMVFYPGALIYLLLPMPWGLNLFCLFHFFLGGLGMFMLARTWTQNGFAASVAGFGYVFGGVLLSCLKWPNNIAALALMPWVVFALERALDGSARQIINAIMVGAAQMLSGAPEVIILTWALAFTLTLARAMQQREHASRLAFRFTIVAASVACLCAIQLLPFLDLLLHSQRDASFGKSQWPMPIWGWANFLVPLFRTFASYHGVHAQPEQYWISTYYVPLFLTCLAFYTVTAPRDMRERALLIVTAICLLVALGDAGLLYKFAKKIIPFLGVMRFPIKFVVVPAFTIPLLAAMALNRLKGEAKLPKLFWRVLGVCAGAIIVIMLLGFFRPIPFENPRVTLINGAVRLELLAILLLVFVRLMREDKVATRVVLGYAVLLLVAVDGLSHAPWQNPTAPKWVFDRGIPQIEPKPELGKSRAMVSAQAQEKLDHLLYPTAEKDIGASRLGLYSNCNLIDEIPKVDGFYALYSKQNHILNLILYGKTNEVHESLMDFLSVTHVTTPGKTVNWTFRSNALPALTIGQQPVPLSPDSIIPALTAPSFAPAKIVFFSGNQTLRATADPEAKILSSHFSPQRIRAEVTSQGAAVLVVNQTWYHWWTATIDQQPARIIPANLAFQALEVPPGQHVIELRYIDQTFRIGLVVSGLTASMLFAFTFRRSGE